MTECVRMSSMSDCCATSISVPISCELPIRPRASQAARWLAMHWLGFLSDAPPLAFIVGVAFFVMIMTNLIMNVAAIAIALPVALFIGPYMGVASEPILFASLAAAGMPFLFLVGAAPNAIAYNSGQFSTARFFVAGIPVSLVLTGVIALFAWVIWDWMGMPILAG